MSRRIITAQVRLETEVVRGYEEIAAVIRVRPDTVKEFIALYADFPARQHDGKGPYFSTVKALQEWMTALVQGGPNATAETKGLGDLP